MQFRLDVSFGRFIGEHRRQGGLVRSRVYFLFLSFQTNFFVRQPGSIFCTRTCHFVFFSITAKMRREKIAAARNFWRSKKRAYQFEDCVSLQPEILYRRKTSRASVLLFLRLKSGSVASSIKGPTFHTRTTY